MINAKYFVYNLNLYFTVNCFYIISSKDWYLQNPKTLSQKYTIDSLIFDANKNVRNQRS